MKKLVTLTILLSLLFSFAEAQNIKKGFRKLDREEYVTAKVIFDEVLEKGDKSEKPAAMHGLALTFSSKSYRGHDPYKALSYALKAKKAFVALPKEQQEDAADIIKLEETEKLISKLDREYISLLKEKEDLILAEKYINELADAPGHKEIVEFRNKLEWEKAKEFNTLHAYQRYIDNYPGSVYVAEAKNAIIRLHYETAAQKNDPDALRSFIEDYPDSELATAAAEKLEEAEYKRALSMNSIEYYDRFLKNYPNSEKVKEITSLRNKKAFEMAQFLNSVESYTKFIKQYPDAEQVAEAREIRNKLAYQEALEQNTPQAFQEFVRNYPDAPQLAEIQEKLQSFNISPKLMEKQQQQQQIAEANLKAIRQYSDAEKSTLIAEKTYDEHGRLTSEMTTDKKKKEKKIYSYTGEAPGFPKVTKISVDGKALEIVEATTDKNGNLMKQDHKCKSQSNMCRDYQEIFMRDNNLHLAQIMHKSGQDTLKIIKVKTNPGGMIIEKHEYSFTEQQEDELIKRYSYNTKGKLVEERWTDEDGTIVRVVTYSFENNRIKSILTYNAVGKKKEVFQYNDKGEIHTATTYSMPSKKVIKTDFYEYEYY